MKLPKVGRDLLLFFSSCFTDVLPRWYSGKESTCPYRRLRRHRLNTWDRKTPFVGNDNPLQYSCLGNSTDRGSWWVRVHGASQIWTFLSNWAYTHKHTHTLCISLSVQHNDLFYVQHKMFCP